MNLTTPVVTLGVRGTQFRSPATSRQAAESLAWFCEPMA